MLKALSSLFSKKEYFFFIVLFIFSHLIMSSTFKVGSTGNLEIATKVWSDFGATIPLIRSFSYGNNFPPQYPIFAGPPIKYHFAFFALIGFLERIGFPLDFSINFLSSITFFAMLFFIYLLGKKVFNKSVGVLAVILTLFNSSFGFLKFFQKNPLSLHTPIEIFKNTTFSSFGPYDKEIVSAFWSLNIYTNQRHLALAYTAFIALLFLLYKFQHSKKPLKNKHLLVIGICIGLFPFVHMPVFAMIIISLGIYFFIFPKLRTRIIIIGLIAWLIALPQILLIKTPTNATNLINPGYLAGNSFSEFTKYWFYNLGFSLFTIPTGFLLAKRRQRVIFLPFLALFIIGNVFQFSPEIAANHKFFNLFIIGANFFSAYFVFRLIKKGIKEKALAIFIILALTLTGIIDVFPIFNDELIVVKDYPNNPTAMFVKNSTPNSSVFLNSTYLYNPANLAGRKIYMGWPYFPWSAGYDTRKRNAKMKELFSPKNKVEECRMLNKEKIDYIEIKRPGELENIEINYQFFDENFKKVFEDKNTKTTIYEVEESCSNVV